jgi:hypothetical protein
MFIIMPSTAVAAVQIVLLFHVDLTAFSAKIINDVLMMRDCVYSVLIRVLMIDRSGNDYCVAQVEFHGSMPNPAERHNQ